MCFWKRARWGRGERVPRAPPPNRWQGWQCCEDYSSLPIPPQRKIMTICTTHFPFGGFHIWRPHSRGEGSIKSRQKERGCMNNVNMTRGERVKKFKILADVIYGRAISRSALWRKPTKRSSPRREESSPPRLIKESLNRYGQLTDRKEMGKGKGWDDSLNEELRIDSELLFCKESNDLRFFFYPRNYLP